MDILDFFTILERVHTCQNPTSIEKLDRLIESCGIEDGQRILDVGCGKGFLLRRIAEKYEVSADGVELCQAFIDEGISAMRGVRLKGNVAFHRMPALEFTAEPESYDVGMCIGASFAIGTFEEMIPWLKKFVKPGGVMAVGDVYAKTSEMPPESAANFSGGKIRSLADTVDVLRDAGLTLIGLIDASLDDWDQYESKHWRAAELWLRENPNHPDRAEFIKMIEEYKYNHLHFDRDALGWAMFVCRVL